jgi:hypothetical protein
LWAFGQLTLHLRLVFKSSQKALLGLYRRVCHKWIMLLLPVVVAVVLEMVVVAAQVGF